jgi:hypothetical protein
MDINPCTFNCWSCIEWCMMFPTEKSEDGQQHASQLWGTCASNPLRCRVIFSHHYLAMAYFACNTPQPQERIRRRSSMDAECSMPDLLGSTLPASKTPQAPDAMLATPESGAAGIATATATATARWGDYASCRASMRASVCAPSLAVASSLDSASLSQMDKLMRPLGKYDAGLRGQSMTYGQQQVGLPRPLWA